MSSAPFEDPLLRSVPDVQGFKLLTPCLIYQRLGAGAMGSVYAAIHLRLDVDVAVKCMLLEHRAGDVSRVVRFKREASLAARVSHPNLVRVYDVLEFKDLHYLVMEHVHGEDLSDRVKRRGAHEVTEALTLICNAASGLAAAHAAGIIHRDIKPANILVSTDGEVKVADLGLAKALEADSAAPDVSITGMGMGTPLYMPPEQFSEASTVGPEADVYALGATLYYMIAGKHAIGGSSYGEILRQVNSEPFPSIRETMPSVPESVEAIIARATAMEPQDRYRNAGEMVRALEELTGRMNLQDIGGSAVETRKPSQDRPSRAVINSAKTAISSRHVGEEAPRVASPSDTIAMKCPGCGNSLRMPARAAGRSGRCPQCGTGMLVPGSPVQGVAGGPGLGRGSKGSAKTVVSTRGRAIGGTAGRQGDAAEAPASRSPLLMGVLLLAVLGSLGFGAMKLWGSSEDLPVQADTSKTETEATPKPFDGVAFDAAIEFGDVDEARLQLAALKPDAPGFGGLMIRLSGVDTLRKSCGSQVTRLDSTSDFDAIPAAIARATEVRQGLPEYLGRQLDRAIKAARTRLVIEARTRFAAALEECDSERARVAAKLLDDHAPGQPPQTARVVELVKRRDGLAQQLRAMEATRDLESLRRQVVELARDKLGEFTCLEKRSSAALVTAHARLDGADSFLKAQGKLKIKLGGLWKPEGLLGVLVEIEDLARQAPQDLDVDDGTADMREGVLASVHKKVDPVQLDQQGVPLAKRITLLVQLDASAELLGATESGGAVALMARAMVEAQLRLITPTSRPEDLVEPLGLLDGLLAARQDASLGGLVEEGLELIRAVLTRTSSAAEDLDMPAARGVVKRVAAVQVQFSSQVVIDVFTVNLSVIVEGVSRGNAPSKVEDQKRWIRELEEWAADIPKGPAAALVEREVASARTGLADSVEAVLAAAWVRMESGDADAPDDAREKFTKASKLSVPGSALHLRAQAGLAEVFYREIDVVADSGRKSKIGPFVEALAEYKKVSGSSVAAQRKKDGVRVRPWSLYQLVDLSIRYAAANQEQFKKDHSEVKRKTRDKYRRLAEGFLRELEEKYPTATNAKNELLAAKAKALYAKYSSKG